MKCGRALQRVIGAMSGEWRWIDPNRGNGRSVHRNAQAENKPERAERSGFRWNGSGRGIWCTEVRAMNIVAHHVATSPPVHPRAGPIRRFGTIHRIVSHLQ